jgi:hypothetical protein
MQLKKYPFEKYTELYFYEFYSIGPKGPVRKLVCFRHYKNIPFNTFNLIFGDSTEGSLEIDDAAVTNNQDTNKVILTVALIVLEFLRHHRNVQITAIGSTQSRNRLYRILIVKFWYEINQHFTVCGYKNGVWVPFEKGMADFYLPSNNNNLRNGNFRLVGKDGKKEKEKDSHSF